MPARSLAALLAFLSLAFAPPAEAASKRDQGSSRLVTDGELAVASQAGDFVRHVYDPATGAVLRRDDTSSFQETFLRLESSLTRNLDRRTILDLDDRLFGLFSSPQEAQTGRLSELENRLRVRLGVAHDERTASEFGLSADHVRTTLDLLDPEDLDLYDAHWLVDRALGRRTFLTFRTGRSSTDYPENPAESHRRVHHRLKLTRYVDAVGRQPAAFKYYLLEDMPESLREETRYMDLAWDMYVGLDAYDMTKAPSTDDREEVVLGTDLNLALSEFASLEAGVSSALGAYAAEQPAKGLLDYHRNRLHLELDHWLTGQLKGALATDLVTTDRRDTAGFDVNDFWHELRLEYSHRPYIQWDVTFSGNVISYDLDTAARPDTRDFRLRSEWTRWYGGRTAFTWTAEALRFRVPSGLESAAVSAHRRVSTGLAWTRLLLDDVTLELGAGHADEDHDLFKQNDLEESFLRSAFRIRF